MITTTAEDTCNRALGEALKIAPRHKRGIAVCFSGFDGRIPGRCAGYFSVARTEEEARRVWSPARGRFQFPEISVRALLLPWQFPFFSSLSSWAHAKPRNSAVKTIITVESLFKAFSFGRIPAPAIRAEGDTLLLSGRECCK